MDAAPAPNKQATKLLLRRQTMKHYILKEPQRIGGFTDLFIISTTANAGGSDFTAAATGQTFTLDGLAIGDCVEYPLVRLDVKTPVSGGAISAATLALGVTSATTQFLGASDVFTGTVAHFTPANSVTSYPTVSSAKDLLATLALTGANATAVTAGEIWIWVAVSRKADRLTDRQA
jgi:hypothetical protein